MREYNMLHNDEDDFDKIDRLLDGIDLGSEVGSESEEESEIISDQSSAEETPITCSELKNAFIFIFALMISLPAFIHLVPYLDGKNNKSYTNTSNYKAMINFEISYEIVLMIMAMYLSAPIWIRAIAKSNFIQSSLQSLSMFKRTTLSGSFGKNKKDAEADDEMNDLSDCELNNRFQDLTKNDCVINDETPLKSNSQRRIAYKTI